MPRHKQPPTSEPTGGYRLLPSQVPDFPASDTWTDLLRWCIAVMDADDRDLGFAASLLSYSVDRGGLTEKQSRHAARTVQRIEALWMADALACQCGDATGSVATRSLSDMDTKGSA